MSESPVFINGLSAKKPHENAPDFVKAKISIKVADMIAWLQGQSGEWVNADLKESREGKLYIAVDTWKPNSGQSAPEPAKAAPAADDLDDDIPF